MLGITTRFVDVVYFMTAVQVIHLFQVAEQIGMVDDLRVGLASLKRDLDRSHDQRGTSTLRSDSRLRAISPKDGIYYQ